MTYFHYQALDGTGKTVHDFIEAESAEQAQSLLAQQGLLVLKLRAKSRTRSHSTRALKLGDRELSWMTRQLASLLDAQLPLEAALSAVIEQSDNAATQHVLRHIRQEIRSGQRLGQALGQFPQIFPDIYRALVDAGEHSGQLDVVLTKLADYIEKRHQLRNKLTNALIYPIIVSIVSVLIVIFMLSYVVPQVVNAFVQTQNSLPPLTVAMIWLSDFTREWGVVCLIVFSLLVVAWRLALRAPALRLAWDAKLLKAPLLGRYLQGVDIARFASTLAILHSSGVPLLAALQAAERTIRNTHLKNAIAQSTLAVQEGSGLAAALRQHQGFPPLLIHLVQSGERTGQLSLMLERAANTLSTELEQRATTSTAILEPLMILFMGGFVMLIVLAVMLPIIELNQLIQ